MKNIKLLILTSVVYIVSLNYLYAMEQEAGLTPLKPESRVSSNESFDGLPDAETITALAKKFEEDGPILKKPSPKSKRKSPYLHHQRHSLGALGDAHEVVPSIRLEFKEDPKLVNSTIFEDVKFGLNTKNQIVVLYLNDYQITKVDLEMLMKNGQKLHCACVAALIHNQLRDNDSIAADTTTLARKHIYLDFKISKPCNTALERELLRGDLHRRFVSPVFEILRSAKLK